MSGNPLIWTKQLGQFNLQEYAPAPNFLNCAIVYTDETDEEEDEPLHFHFFGWGVEREQVTEEMCAICCQGLIYQDANTSLTNFFGNYEWAKLLFDEDDEAEFFDDEEEAVTNYPQPDPAWPYYQLWQQVTTAHAALEEAMKYMATEECENPNLEADKAHVAIIQAGESLRKEGLN